MAPRIFIFSIVLGAEYLSYVKSIETHARAFLPLNTSAVGSVVLDTLVQFQSFSPWPFFKVEVNLPLMEKVN